MSIAARLAFVGVAACASTPPPKPAPKPEAAPAAQAQSEFAPMLFTLEQLRAGNPQGRTIEFRFEAEGKPTTIQHWEFAKVDAQQATIHSVTRDEAGKILGDDTGSSTWEELLKHGQFPATTTKIEDGVSVTVPAGTFKTRLYTVTDDGAVRRFWFSVEYPGPPVQFTTEQAGKTVLRAQMLRVK